MVMIKRIIATLATAFILVTGLQSMATAAPVPPTAALPLTNVALSETASKKLSSSWSWYVARSSGMLAAILLVLLILSGVGLLTGMTYRLLEPLPAWAIHRAIGLSFGVLTVVHIVVLLFDKFVGFSLIDVLVPFATDYQPVKLGGMNLGSLWIALGVIAFYAIIAVIISSLFWMQSKPRPWKLIHFMSYGILVMVFLHGLFSGTDLKSGFWRFLWIFGGVVVAVSIAARLRRAHTISGGSKKV